jgi:N-acyl-D-amino-acid deacylase
LGKLYPHPRAYGSFPRIMGKYVRDRRVISLEEAIRKSTSYPASIFGIKDRGVIREGMKADVVVFDRNNILDRATYLSPHQYSEGVKYVIVNGSVSFQ